MKNLYDEVLRSAKDNDCYVLRKSLTRFIKIHLVEINEILLMMSQKDFCESLSKDTGVEIDQLCFNSAYRRSRQYAERAGGKKTSLEYKELASTKGKEEPKEKALNPIPIGSNHSASKQATNNVSNKVVSELEQNLNEIGLDRMTIEEVLNSGISWEELCESCDHLAQKSPLLKTTHGSNIRGLLRKRKNDALMATLPQN